MVCIVVSAFLFSQIHVNTLRPILRQLLSNEALDTLLINNWPKQVVNTPAPVGLFLLLWVSRRQAKAEGGRSHQRGLSPGFGWQVMYLIAQEHAKAIPIFGYQVTCRVIRGDRDRQDTFLATVVHADLCLKGIDQPCIPLVDECNGWDNDQR